MLWPEYGAVMHFARIIAPITACAGLAACQPPAADNYAERAPDIPHREAPLPPIDSPDTTRAIWNAAGGTGRIVYGVPGKMPYLSLACVEVSGKQSIRVTRFVTADPQAEAIMAIIGNGHRARLPIPAVWNGHGWLWEADYPADLPDLDVFTGVREIELTLPGAGTLAISPGQLPGRLVEDCRAKSQPSPRPVPPEGPASAPEA